MLLLLKFVAFTVRLFHLNMSLANVVAFSQLSSTVKLCSPRERNTEIQFLQYYPTLEDNTEITHNDS